MKQQTIPDPEIIVAGVTLYPVATLFDDYNICQIVKKGERYVVYERSNSAWLEMDDTHADIAAAIKWLKEGEGLPI